MKKEEPRPSVPSEQEAYFARKNKRYEWWHENWDKFIFYPFFAFTGLVVLTLFFILGSFAVTKTGLWQMRKNHESPVPELEQRVKALEERVSSFYHPDIYYPNPSIILTNNGPGAWLITTNQSQNITNLWIPEGPAVYTNKLLYQ